MDPKDLLKLLDLDGDPPDPGGAPPVIAAAEGGPDAGTSITALDVDAWGLRRGRDLAAEGGRLGAAGESAAADFFWAAFDPAPALLPDCVDPGRREFLAGLLDSPAYGALRADTRLDDTAAAIAAAHFAAQYAGLADGPDTAGVRPDAGAAGDLGALPRRRPAPPSRRRGNWANCATPATPSASAPASPARPTPPPSPRCSSGSGPTPAWRGCANWPAGSGPSPGASSAARPPGLDENDGVGPGGDLGRLLPVELARLADPDFGPDALRRLAERQSLCRESHSPERVGKGPVVVTVDESGSMHGGKAESAKALALTLAWVARRQRRWCGLVAYSGDSGERLLALPPGRWDGHRLADWVAAFIGRGSSLDVPVRELPRMLAELGAPKGVTDVVVVTDAQCRIPDADRDRFLAWKRAGRARRRRAGPGRESRRPRVSLRRVPLGRRPLPGRPRRRPRPLDLTVETPRLLPSRPFRYHDSRSSRMIALRNPPPALPAAPAVPVGTPLLGEVITWSCSGSAPRHADLVSALEASGLDPGVARSLAPRHAFARACKRLARDRVIRQVSEDAQTLTFQFTAESRAGDRLEYTLETLLTLDKKSGLVGCDLPGLASLAQGELDRAVELRTGADVTRVVQKLFERSADLFPVREAGGCYFVPAVHAPFVDRVQRLLGRLNGRVARFPVPAGTPAGDASRARRGRVGAGGGGGGLPRRGGGVRRGHPPLDARARRRAHPGDEVQGRGRTRATSPGSATSSSATWPTPRASCAPRSPPWRPGPPQRDSPAPPALPDTTQFSRHHSPHKEDAMIVLTRGLARRFRAAASKYSPRRGPAPPRRSRCAPRGVC